MQIWLFLPQKHKFLSVFPVFVGKPPPSQKGADHLPNSLGHYWVLGHCWCACAWVGTGAGGRVVYHRLLSGPNFGEVNWIRLVQLGIKVMSSNWFICDFWVCYGWG